MTTHKKFTSMAVAAALGASAMAMPLAAKAELSGNIGVFSKYVLRGLTNDAESDNVAVQGGLDWTHDSGFYLGYWGSSLDYTYDPDGGPVSGNGFENDIYGGYTGSFGGFSYDVGLIQYYYIDVEDSDLTEFKASIGYGPAYLQAQYLLNDGWWGNAGDIYWTLGYDMALPKDFTLSAVLGWYTYDDDDNSELGGCGGVTPCAVTTEDTAYRHFNLTLSHPIGNTGADWAITYINGGKDRTGTDQEDTVVLSLTYGFDI